MKKLIALALALVLACAVSLAAADTLRVGMECNYAPYNWTQAEPDAEGHAVAIAAVATPRWREKNSASDGL